MYKSNRFEFLVLYGRRRTGKTELLKQFSKEHKTLFLLCIGQNSTLNLELFSEVAQKYFFGTYVSAFRNWIEAFNFIGENAKKSKEKVVLIIDEFPFLAGSDESIKSVLQHAIDHIFKDQNILLILCGSSISFMENELLAEKSPLYGRTTAQYELKPFDYYDSSLFFPNWTSDKKILAYGILSGIPYYLQLFDEKKSITDNLAKYVFNQSSILYDEPQYLLRMELRQPATYNSILEAIVNGQTKINTIKDKTHIDSSKCSKYIDTLTTLRLVTKEIPCGDKPSSKKSLYAISDPFIHFWYKFLFSNKQYIEMIGAEKAAEEAMKPDSIHAYMGHIFEEIAKQYMLRQAKENKLPFFPAYIGRWWGNNPERKCEDDIDILLIDKEKKKYMLCECKYKNEQFDLTEYKTLKTRQTIFKDGKQFYYYIFSKNGFTNTA